MKEKMDRAREIAARVQAGERAAMRRWLMKRKELFKTLSVVGMWDMSMEDLEAEVLKLNGKPEKLKAEGRKRVVDLIVKGQ